MVVRWFGPQRTCRVIGLWVDVREEAGEGDCREERVPDGSPAGVAWGIPTNSTPPDSVDSVTSVREGEG